MLNQIILIFQAAMFPSWYNQTQQHAAGTPRAILQQMMMRGPTAPNPSPAYVAVTMNNQLQGFVIPGQFPATTSTACINMATQPTPPMNNAAAMMYNRPR